MLGMDGWGWGWGMGIIHGLLWWAILILGIIVLVRLLGRDSSRAATAPPAETAALDLPKNRATLEARSVGTSSRRNGATSRPERAIGVRIGESRFARKGTDPPRGLRDRRASRSC